ncbi:MAG: hypothetical protein GX444_17750 [Myxococcales bacterium]|nr:hypothetical protein [Myxococcales bacterium]
MKWAGANRLSGAGYLVRWLVALAIGLAWLGYRLSALYYFDDLDRPWANFQRLVACGGQLDIFHRLFYLDFALFLLLLLLPPHFFRRRFVTLGIWRFFLPGLLAGAAVFFGTTLGEDRLTARADFFLVCLLLAANISLLFSLDQVDQPIPARRSWWIRLFPLADFLLPLAVWSQYRSSSSIRFRLSKPLPLVFLLALTFLPWLLDPEPLSRESRNDPPLRHLATGSFYQVTVEPQVGLLWTISQKEGSIHRFAADGSKSPEPAGIVSMDQAAVIQAAGFDGPERKWVIVDVASGNTYVADIDGGSIRTIPADKKTGTPDDACRTHWNRDAGLLFADCTDGLRLLCPDGRTVKAVTNGLPGDALYDADRRQILFAAWGMPLLALDPTDLSVIRSLPIPARPERLALDRAGGRLLLSIPIPGELWVIDASSLQLLRRVPTLPGQRVARIDERRGLIWLGGLLPIVEARSLTTFAVVRHYRTAPWIRWLDLDPRNGRVYFTNEAGLWELDTAGEDRASIAAGLSRLDPFYPLLSRAVALSSPADRLGWRRTTPIPRRRGLLSTAVCDDRAWYSPSPGE